MDDLCIVFPVVVYIICVIVYLGIWMHLYDGEIHASSLCSHR